MPTPYETAFIEAKEKFRYLLSNPKVDASTKLNYVAEEYATLRVRLERSTETLMAMHSPPRKVA